MRTLDELLAVEDPALPVLRGWLDAGEVDVRLLPVEPDRRDACLTGLQVTVRSVLGTVAYETGGLLVDHGWLRLLGGGHETLPSLYEAAQVGDAAQGYLVLGWDVVGGVFALDTGGLGRSGQVFYYAPDALQWEDLGLGYAELVQWVLSGGVRTLAEDLRWEGWRGEADALGLDEGCLLDPPLWAAGSEGAAEASRTSVALTEILSRQGRAARRSRGPGRHRTGLTTRFTHR